MEGGIKAAAAGHDVVMAPATHCYFDYTPAKGHDFGDFLMAYRTTFGGWKPWASTTDATTESSIPSNPNPAD